ncbi:MAG TPA: D-aminoacyl-tRNA deacylase [Chloroflexota bacterium]|nr:D-aminoacyl-tRNA deacylase [Chloroflexota bacterium]
MRAVVQRVRRAQVWVGERQVAGIDRGLLILLGIRDGDSTPGVDAVADKIARLRLWEDSMGKMNLDTSQVGGAMLVVSQFTLYGDIRRGRRPSFSAAASPEESIDLYRRVISRLRESGYAVEHGEFGAHMLVTLENDGPVTLLVDSNDLLRTFPEPHHGGG